MSESDIKDNKFGSTEHVQKTLAGIYGKRWHSLHQTAKILIEADQL